MLRISLVTLGDPGRLTGGYLYHRRMAELAGRFDARIDFVSFPDRLAGSVPVPFPLPLLLGPSVLRSVRRSGAQVTVLDSIAAAYLGPWLAVIRAAGRVGRAGRDLPLVGMLHQPPGGIDFGPARSAIQAGLDRLAYARARLLLVASEALARELEATGIPRERLRVVPPGRDVAGGASAASRRPGRYDVAAGADLRHGRRCAFLCVGNWVERKGILPLLEAFGRLPAATGTLHLAGDMNADRGYASRVRSRLARADLADRVVVHGPLPRETVDALYQTADVFVLPSTREPYGTVYGEAMAAGLPVVGWSAGNLPYLAENGVEGLLVTPGDIEGLAGALRQLADDDRYRHELGRAAARRALQLPTWLESAEMFFGALREVVTQAS